MARRRAFLSLIVLTFTCGFIYTCSSRSSLVTSSVALIVHLALVAFSRLQLVYAPRPTCISKRSRRYQHRTVVCLLLMISGNVHPHLGPALIKHAQSAYSQLSLNGMKYIDVPGDGHCFICALRISIINFFGLHVSINYISAFLRDELIPDKYLLFTRDSIYSYLNQITDNFFQKVLQYQFGRL